MNKFTHYYGIDISKDVFDVMDQTGTHRQFENTTTGFLKFKKYLKNDCCCVMEATGVYQVQLADFLYDNNIFHWLLNVLFK